MKNLFHNQIFLSYKILFFIEKNKNKIILFYCQ